VQHGKRRLQFSSKIVIASVTAVTLYTLALLFLVLVNIANHQNVWPPVELTGLWFAFWTVEIVMLASIKKSKIKNKYEKEDDGE